ncbi:MAG: hypothetical protein ACTHMG_00485 [Sphingomonas sp.]
MAPLTPRRKKVDYVCAHCGSSNVSHDAWADWDAAAQRWVLGAMFDYAHCHVCEGKTWLEERPIK